MGTETHTPALRWDPGWLHSTKPLSDVGEIAGSPFTTFATALAAADGRRTERAEASPADNIFLITCTTRGWVVFEYTESRIGRADIEELEVGGLPLGGSVDNPRTYVVDARGSLGRLTAMDSRQRYAFRRVDRASLEHPDFPDCHLPAVVPETVVNHAGNVQWNPRIALLPSDDATSLTDALRWIHDHLPPDVKVKAGGWRHSWSPVAATDGVYIHPEQMSGVQRLSSASTTASLMRDDIDSSRFFRITAGTRIRHINAALWDEGLALPYLGGYDGQTLGGVLPTGTHGSALRFGPLAEMVKSVDLIRFDGTPVRIEPASNAVTSPEVFQRERPAWHLAQNDDDFHAVLISMGTMGIVHSLVVEAVPRFWMQEVRTATTMPEAQGILAGGNVYHLIESEPKPNWIDPLDDRAFGGHPKPAYHEELLWNPYSDKVVVTSRHPVSVDQRRELEHGEPAWFADAPIRNLFRALKLDAMPDEYSRPDLTELVTELLSGVLDEAVEAIAEVRPQLLPEFIDVSLDGLPDPCYIQRSYNVFNVGQGANAIPAQSGTISIPLRDDMWLQAIDIIRTTARRFAEARTMYQTGPISLRFVRGSDILLADPEDVCKFEIILGGDNDRVKALSLDFVREYYQALYTSFGRDVRLHWGQLIPEGTLDAPGSTDHRIRESYPRYDVWRAIRDRYDPLGRGMNRWQETLLP